MPLMIHDAAAQCVRAGACCALLQLLPRAQAASTRTHLQAHLQAHRAQPPLPHLVAPDGGEDVVELDVDGRERQEARHRHLKHGHVCIACILGIIKCVCTAELDVDGREWQEARHCHLENGHVCIACIYLSSSVKCVCTAELNVDGREREDSPP